MDFVLSAEDNMIFNVTLPADETAAPTVLFQLPDSTKVGTVGWSVVCNETSFAGLGPSGFFLPDSQADNTAGAKALEGLADGVNVDGQQVDYFSFPIDSWLILYLSDQFPDIPNQEPCRRLAFPHLLWSCKC